MHSNVRSSNSVLMVCWILLSVSRSTDALADHPHPHVRRSPQRPGKRTHVASSSTTTLQSFTSARARLNNDRSPTLRFAPSLSITLSNVYRVPLPVFSSRNSCDLSLIDGVVTRQDLRSASHNLASSYLLNGSRFDRIVPVGRP